MPAGRWRSIGAALWTCATAAPLTRWLAMARPVTVTIPHQLGRDEARRRVDASLDQFKAQLGGVGLGAIRHAWAQDRLGFNAEAFGQTVTGRIDVTDTDLHIEVLLPGLLGAFAGKVAGQLRQQGRLLIEKK